MTTPSLARHVPRSLVQAKMDRMKWDTRPQIYASLRLLADMAIDGTITVAVSRPNGALMLDFEEVKDAR